MKNRTDELINFYDNLRKDNLPTIIQFYAEDCYFRDPFHELHDLNSLYALYEKMYVKMKNPIFKVTNSFYDEEKKEVVLFWDFYFNDKFKISGNTLFKFNDHKMIISHIDYWDTVSELWLKFPIIKTLIKQFYKIVF